METDGGPRAGRSWSRWIAVSGSGLLALLVLAGAFAATRPTPERAIALDESAGPAPELAPEDIYPSLAQPAGSQQRPDYAELFVTGQSLPEVAKPACPRYRSALDSWSRRARSVLRGSVGAERSPKTAASWYAGVVWVSQDDAGEFRRALSRISRSRVSAATRGAVKRGAVVSAFTSDALALCGLTDESARMSVKLGRLDRRVTRLIGLARLNSSSGSEVNVIQ